MSCQYVARGKRSVTAMRSGRSNGSKDEDYRFAPDIDLRDAGQDDSPQDEISFEEYESRRDEEWATDLKSESPLWLKISIALVSLVIVVSLLAGLIGPFFGGSQSETRSAGEFSQATLVEVIDARTIVVEVDGEQETVRYIGIEPFDIGSRWRDYAAEANRQILADGRITLESDGVDRDESGRLLRYVYVGRNMVNGLLIRNGFGILGPLRDGGDRYSAEMSSWSDAAKGEELGIWGDPLGRPIQY